MLNKYFDISGKVILLTGGSGQLGLSYTKALLNCGATVVNWDLQSNDVIADKNYYQFKVDITSVDEIKSNLEDLKSNIGIPDVLINNAALDTPPSRLEGSSQGRFEDFPEDLWDATFKVNVDAVFYLCKFVGALMKKNGGGNIVNISSIYGLVSPDPSLYHAKGESPSFFKPVAYSSSKSSLIAFTKYLAVYWAKDNIKVNTLVISGVLNNQDQLFLDNYNSRIPIGRMANADEFVPALILLSSGSNTYMTGSVLTIDGGWTAI